MAACEAVRRVDRWRIDLAYDGTDLSGWAVQAGRRTVQGELELWLARVLRLPEPARLVCAGRTDAGVHAHGQVAHVDLPVGVCPDADALVRRLRRALPDDIAVAAFTPAPPGFDARFSAIWRHYVYRIADASALLDPLARRLVVAEPALDLDVAAMAAAGRTLVGLRDFAAFCRRRVGATTVRTLLELTASRVPDGPSRGVVELGVRADAFCHSMVRSLTGALVEVGAGRRDLDWLTALTTADHRSSEVKVMPPHGLTLETVGYPPDDRLAIRAAQARSRRSLVDV